MVFSSEVHYATEIVTTLMKDGYFESNEAMDPIILFQEVEKASSNKYKKSGTYMLSADEFEVVHEKAMSRSIDDALAMLIEDGYIKAVGVTPEGELLYDLANRKKEEPIEVSGKFESYLPQGPKISLN